MIEKKCPCCESGISIWNYRFRTDLLICHNKNKKCLYCRKCKHQIDKPIKSSKYYLKIKFIAIFILLTFFIIRYVFELEKVPEAFILIPIALISLLSLHFLIFISYSFKCYKDKNYDDAIIGIEEKKIQKRYISFEIFRMVFFMIILAWAYFYLK